MSLKVDVTITQSDLRKLNKRLDALVKRTQDLSPFFEEAGGYLVNATRHRILRSKKGPNGEKWPALSQMTIDMKGHSTPLYHSGALARSIHVVAYDRSGVIVSSSEPYAELMQYGFYPTSGLTKGKTIPARPFMGISNQNVKVLSSMLKEYVAGRAGHTPGYGGDE
jgi:phage virion morphogenesis protein